MADYAALIRPTVALLSIKVVDAGLRRHDGGGGLSASATGDASLALA